MGTGAFPPTSKESAQTVPDIFKDTVFCNFLECKEVFELDTRERFVNENCTGWPREDNSRLQQHSPNGSNREVVEAPFGFNDLPCQ